MIIAGGVAVISGLIFGVAVYFVKKNISERNCMIS